jgi:tetratricopeptide (TPR) repeat protein
MAARILLESGGYWKAEEAIAFSEAWLSQRNGSVSANFWDNLAHLYGKLGNHGKHEECLRKALELDGSVISFASGIINLLLDQGKNREAVSFGEEWLSKQTRALDDYVSEGFWNGLGLANDRVGNYDRAADCFPYVV